MNKQQKEPAECSRLLFMKESVKRMSAWLMRNSVTTACTPTFFSAAKLHSCCSKSLHLLHMDNDLLSTYADRQGVDISVTVSLFFVMLYVCLYSGGFLCEDNASGVQLCMAVHRRPGQGMSHFGELYSPRSPKLAGESASTRNEL